MSRLRAAVLIACGLIVGCGGDPVPPTEDAAAEKADAQRIKSAAAAERKAKLADKKSARNPDDR